MSSLPTAYTPLESLLLFQALRAGGVEPSSFSRISEQLKSIPLVQNDPSYDPGRLSPDALRQLYLDLLKEEARRDVDRQLNNGTQPAANGDASPGSRKRKAPSPHLPTIHEAAQHSHLIPQLVTRLYTRYRENTVKDIREHERKYDQLAREVREIEAGKWDERLWRQRAKSATGSPQPPVSAHTQLPLDDLDRTQTRAAATPSQTSPPRAAEPALPTNPFSQAKIDAVMNHGPESDNNAATHRRASSNTTLPPLSEMAPHSPRYSIPPRMSQPGPNGFQPSPPSAQPVPFPPHHAHPSANALGSPQVQNSTARQASSPRAVLPPPPGMPVPPHLPSSPAATTVASPQSYQAQSRMSVGHAVPQPAHEPQQTGATPIRTQQSTQSPSLQVSTGHYQQQPYHDHRTSYLPSSANQPPQSYPVQGPHGGGYMLPPFQVTPQDPAKSNQHAPVPQYRPQQSPTHATIPAMYPQQSQQQQQHYLPNAPATGPRPHPQSTQELMSGVLAALATPPRQQRQPVWKIEKGSPPNQTPGSPTRPAVEPLSPHLARAPSPLRKGPFGRKSDRAAVEQSATQQRRPLRRSHYARDGSVASSTVDGSMRATRSVSVSSAVDVTPALEDRLSTKRRVKPEPSTPAIDQEDDADQTTASGVLTRKRRGTLQSATQALPSSKRRRRHSPDAGREEADLPDPALRSNTVVATRNFAKMSSVIMNEINSHKHGSRFAQPVRDRDADGYSAFVKRPQDLKSIRSAITHGARAIVAATASAVAGSSPPASSSATPSAATGLKGAEPTVELERTADLIPPRAVVNGVQLEKEVMRMLANAVMFNPGEDGMVADTREMFADVEAKITEWRGAERDTGVSASAGVGDEEEEEEGRAKRRKV